MESKVKEKVPIQEGESGAYLSRTSSDGVLSPGEQTVGYQECKWRKQSKDSRCRRFWRKEE